MSAEATGLVWKWSPYTGSPLLVHLAVADVVNDAHGNEFWMSVPSLARKVRCGRSTVFSALAHMCEHGYLERLESGQDEGKPSRYRFLVDKFPAPVQNRDAPVQNGRWHPSRIGTQNSRTNTKGTGGSFPQGKPDCVRCHGSGTFYNATGGFDVACSCVESENENARAGGGAS